MFIRQWKLNFEFFITGFSKPTADADDTDIQNDETDDYNYDDDDNKSGQDRLTKKEENNANSVDIINSDPPYFETKEYSTTAKEGDTAVLACDVKNFKSNLKFYYFEWFFHIFNNFFFFIILDTNIILWYNQTNLLFQAKIRVPNDERLSVDDKHSLHIAHVQPTDDSQYYCEILPNEIRLKVNLEVHTAPVAYIYQNGRDISGRSITFHQGDPIELECKGTGRPESTIKWFSNGERLGGSQGIHVNGGIMAIDRADHQHVRMYQCLADNGIAVGHTTVNINVKCKILVFLYLIALNLFTKKLIPI